MRYLTLDEVLELHRLITEQFGGSCELRDPKALDAAISAPHATFSGNDLYPGVVEKAAVLCFLLIANHPFLDGNKRVGHAAMETFLRLRGWSQFAIPWFVMEALLPISFVRTLME